jgi:hypothetical protein
LEWQFVVVVVHLVVIALAKTSLIMITLSPEVFLVKKTRTKF